MSTADAPVVKIVKGTATPAELAALTSVLLSRAAARAAAGPGPQDRARRPTAAWRRPERLPVHRDPRGWRAAGSRVA